MTVALNPFLLMRHTHSDKNDTCKGSVDLFDDGLFFRWREKTVLSACNPQSGVALGCPICSGVRNARLTAEEEDTDPLFLRFAAKLGKQIGAPCLLGQSLPDWALG